MNVTPLHPSSVPPASVEAPPPPASEPRVLRPRRAAPADAVRPTRAEVNLQALRHNLHVARRHAGSSAVWAVLKADAYGHGAPAVARTLERAGADGFCVALLEEGIELRDAGIRAPILVMGGYYGGAYAELVARRLTPVVYDRGQIEGLARLVTTGQVPGPISIHLKVDTGMARLGVSLAELKGEAGIAARLAALPQLHVVGLMTHLASADADTLEDVHAQMARFEEATRVLAAHGIRPTVRHAANSAALLRGEALLDLVRPGLALFGASPVLTSGRRLSSDLRPVMKVRSEIVDLRDVAAGDTVGYGGTFRASRPSRIATVPIGYADGLSRHLSNRGHLLVRGARAPICGAVSMDMSMIDVTDLPGASLRDEVVVLGAQDGPLGESVVTADEIAAHMGSIPWEVLTSISRRVPRFYREP
jgi:alanine racemase